MDAILPDGQKATKLSETGFRSFTSSNMSIPYRYIPTYICMYVYMYVCILVHMYLYIYIYTYAFFFLLLFTADHR